jgi:endoglucanase
MRSFCLTLLAVFFFSLFIFSSKQEVEKSWIRINLLGYKPGSSKVAVWCSKEEGTIKTFQLINAETKKIAWSGSAGKAYGIYGPFRETYRLNFSAFNKAGRYYLQAGNTKSPEFIIGPDVYQGAADFCLKYMRQQRSFFNPYLKDSCHTKDGYVLYGMSAGFIVAM